MQMGVTGVGNRIFFFPGGNSYRMSISWESMEGGFDA